MVPWRHRLRSLLTQRLLHFAVLGAVIFALDPSPLAGPMAVELGSERDLEDELLYREAIRLGLADSDPIVRRRLIQRALFLAEDLGGASREPTVPELRQYFEQQRGRYTIAERFHFVHVFARDERRCADLKVEAETWSRSNPGPLPPPRIGEAFPTSREFAGDRQRLAQTYGEEFAAAVEQQPLNEWSAPIASKYGFHLVRILDRQPAEPMSFERAQGRLRLDYLADLKKRAVAQYLKAASGRYRIEIDGTRLSTFEPRGRAAARSASSLEDG